MRKPSCRKHCFELCAFRDLVHVVMKLLPYNMSLYDVSDCTCVHVHFLKIMVFCVRFISACQ